MSVNKAIILGRLGKDPDLKYTPGQSAFCRFSIATSEHWKDGNGEKKERTEWHNITCFGKRAELADKYLNKGSMVYIEGRISTRSYEKDGQTKYITEILADVINFIGGKQEQARSPQDEYGAMPS